MSGSSRMSHCVVPNWNNILRHQRQEHVDEHQEGNITSHHHHVQNPNPNHSINKSNNNNNNSSNQENLVKELTWENGHIAMHGHGLNGLMTPSGPSKPMWARTNGTLESIVHQGTSHTSHGVPNKNVTWTPATTRSSDIARSSAGKWDEYPVGPPPGPMSETRKRARSDSDQGGTKNFSRGNNNNNNNGSSMQGGASGSATFCRDSDSTMVTWASFESPHTHSLNKNKSTDEDSASHGCLNKDEDCDTKGESGRSNNSTRRSRAAAVHNQSERRRRDRINQKMKALQKLVPNASKTDKASMLDEVIEYLKQLQSQLQMMNTVRNMPQSQAQAPTMMMMPLSVMHHHHQQQLMSSILAARMGLFDMTSLARAPAPMPLTPLPHLKHVGSSSASSSSSSPPTLPDPYWALLAQSMNMDLYNKMAALYSQQQVSQTSAQATTPSQLQLQPHH